MTAPRTTWGIVGTGRIAATFVEAMALVPDGEIAAVASRDQCRADAFAAQHGIATGYGDAHALAEDPAIDAVYIATPHSRHCDDTLLFLGAGKHVLCEKPLAINAAQARRMTSAALTHRRFLMEALWTRFLPAYRSLVEVLAQNTIGQPQLVEADFGFRAPFDPAGRLFDPHLGGGALLDVGIYPLQLCSLVLGAPDQIGAAAVIGDTGVDELVVAILGHGADRLGLIKASIRTTLANTARIAGTEGWIAIPAPMYCPEHIDVWRGATHKQIAAPFEPGGFRFQIAEVQLCIAEGRLESRTVPHAESVALADTMDRIRAKIGVTYPTE